LDGLDGPTTETFETMVNQIATVAPMRETPPATPTFKLPCSDFRGHDREVLVDKPVRLEDVLPRQERETVGRIGALAALCVEQGVTLQPERIGTASTELLPAALADVRCIAMWSGGDIEYDFEPVTDRRTATPSVCAARDHADVPLCA